MVSISTQINSAVNVSMNPELGTWEHWINAIKSDGKNGLPGRPDAKVFADELPIWVDCHLSWHYDQPNSKKSKFLSNIVLRSDNKSCKGQLEQWAH